MGSIRNEPTETLAGAWARGQVYGLIRAGAEAMIQGAESVSLVIGNMVDRDVHERPEQMPTGEWDLEKLDARKASELDRLRKVEKAAEDLAVIINTDPHDLARSRLEVEAYQKLVAALRTSPLAGTEKETP